MDINVAEREKKSLIEFQISHSIIFKKLSLTSFGLVLKKIYNYINTPFHTDVSI